MLSLGSARLIATSVVLVVFVVMAVISLSAWGSPTYWFPGFVAIAGVLAAAASLIRDIRTARRGDSILSDDVTDLGASITDAVDDPDAPVDEEAAAAERSAIRWRVLAWTGAIIALPLLALVVPFFYASIIWLVAVMRFLGKRKWLMIAISVGIFAVVLNVLIVLLEIRMPPAILTGWG